MAKAQRADESLQEYIFQFSELVIMVADCNHINVETEQRLSPLTNTDVVNEEICSQRLSQKLKRSF